MPPMVERYMYDSQKYAAQYVVKMYQGYAMTTRGFSKVMLCVCLLVGLMLMPARSLVAADTVATDIRVGHHDGYTRFVLDLSKAVNVRVFKLDAPYRVVLDMPEVGWRLPAKPLPGPTGLFKTMRYGLYQAGQSRVVLETSYPVAVKSAFFLADTGVGNRRFVLDLVASDRATFLAGLNQAIQVAETGAGYQAASLPNVTIPSLPANSATKAVGALAPAPDPVPVASVTSAQPALLPAPVKPVVPAKAGKHVIVVDPGHGGADPGTIGNSGVYEKHITIAMARQIKQTLEATGRYKVVLTRDRDVFIRLRDRVNISRKAGAELFISVHADSIKNKKISGSSVYTLSEKASDKEAAMLAEKENKVDLIAGIDLSGESQEVTNILIDLAQRESMNESAKFANILVNELKRSSKVLRNTHRFAGFAVLKAPDVPSVLVEVGFLSNPTDERNLRSRKYRQKIAKAMLKGIDRYFAGLQQAQSN